MWKGPWPETLLGILKWTIHLTNKSLCQWGGYNSVIFSWETICKWIIKQEEAELFTAALGSVSWKQTLGMEICAGGFLESELGSSSSVGVREAGLSRGKIGTHAGATKASVSLRANTTGVVLLKCPKLSKGNWVSVYHSPPPPHPHLIQSSHCTRQPLCLRILPERGWTASCQQLAFPTAGAMNTPVLQDWSTSTTTLSGSRPKIKELRATTGFWSSTVCWMPLTVHWSDNVKEGND